LSILGSTEIAGAFSAPVILGTLIDLTGAYTAAFLYAVAVTIVGGALVLSSPENNVTGLFCVPRSIWHRGGGSGARSAFCPGLE
jgi:hypothetical protein